MADQFFESGKRSKRASSARHLFAARDAFQEDMDLRADAAEATENATEGSKREEGSAGRGAFAGYVPKPVEIANAGRGIQQEHGVGEQFEWVFPYDERQEKQEECVPTRHDAALDGYAGYAPNAANDSGKAQTGFTPNEIGEQSVSMSADEAEASALKYAAAGYAGYAPNEPSEPVGRSASPANAASEAAAFSAESAEPLATAAGYAGYAGYAPNEPSEPAGRSVSLANAASEATAFSAESAERFTVAAGYASYAPNEPSEPVGRSASPASVASEAAAFSAESAEPPAAAAGYASYTPNEPSEPVGRSASPANAASEATAFSAESAEGFTVAAGYAGYADYTPNEPSEPAGQSASPANVASEATAFSAESAEGVTVAAGYASYTPNEPSEPAGRSASPASAASEATAFSAESAEGFTVAAGYAGYADYAPNEPSGPARRSSNPANAASEATAFSVESAASLAVAAGYVGYAQSEPSEPATPDSIPAQERSTTADIDFPPNTPVNSAAEATPSIQAPIDFSAYYRRDEAPTVETAERSEPAFAPPPKMDAYFPQSESLPVDPELPLTQAANVYRPREATWADTARRKALDDTGYQVREDRRRKRRRKKKRHPVRSALLIALALVMLCGAGYLMREELGEWASTLTATPAPSAEAFTPVTTPEPVKGYDAAPPLDIADGTRARISAVSGTVAMETCAVTDLNVLTRNLRPDGTYDYYLFTSAEGRLLCYFEGLGEQDMYPQTGGGFYVRQAPYLVGANGAATIRLADLEASLGETLLLHPMYNGWSVTENANSANYLNSAGQLFSRLWFSRAFPFTGEYTLAYVDTGTTDENQRYLLYILGADGSMNRWLATEDTSDVVVVINGMAYMNDGKLYQLPDTSAPLLTTPRLDVYVNCGAMVVQDAETGKLALYVNGEQHYDFAYDSIHPVESDIRWTEMPMEGEQGVCTVHTVAGTAYPQPLAHYFALEREGQTEYVALSSVSNCPIVLEGELVVPEQGGMNP